MKKLFSAVTKFGNFDEVTKFRLINSFLVAIGMSLLSPILITLKGLYLAVYVISMFGIISQFAVKSNEYMTKKFSIAQMWKMGIIIHLMYIFIAGIFFINPLVMIWLDSMLVIVEIAVFSSYSILLNNYIADYYPKSMQDFQVVRNSSWADGFLIGLSVVTFITYFWTIGVAIGAVIVFNIAFSTFMIKNWHFFDKIENLKEI